MARNPVPTVPHSWRLDDWPRDVFPGAASKGRYVVRAHRTELRSEEHTSDSSH